MPAGSLWAALSTQQDHVAHGSGPVASQEGWRKQRPGPRSSETPVPFKANAARRHRIPKQRHRVTSWRADDASLRQRGSLTVWFTEEAIAAWRAEPRTTRGGQPWYSPLAILTALTLRTVFRLALRQTEGLIGSILQLPGLDLAVPDHSTLSRRAEALEVPRPRSSPGSGPVHLRVDSTGLRLLQAQHGRCPLCGELLLHADHPPQTPPEWERWLVATRKAMVRNAITRREGGTPGETELRLVHAHCHRRHAEHGNSPALPHAREPTGLA